MSDTESRISLTEQLIGLPAELVQNVLGLLLVSDTDIDPEGQVDDVFLHAQTTALRVLDSSAGYHGHFQVLPGRDKSSMDTLVLYDADTMLAPRLVEPPTLRLNSLDFVRRLVLTGLSTSMTERQNQRSVKHMQPAISGLLAKIRTDRASGNQPTVLPCLKQIAWLPLSNVSIPDEETDAINKRLESVERSLFHQISSDLLQITHEIEGEMCQHEGPLLEAEHPPRLDCSRASLTLHLNDAALRRIRAVLTTGSVKTGPQTWYIRSITDLEYDDVARTGRNIRAELKNCASNLRTRKQEPLTLTTHVPRPYTIRNAVDEALYLSGLRSSMVKRMIKARTSDADIEARRPLDMALAKNANGEDVIRVGYSDEAPPCNVCHYPKND